MTLVASPLSTSMLRVAAATRQRGARRSPLAHTGVSGAVSCSSTKRSDGSVEHGFVRSKEPEKIRLKTSTTRGILTRSCAEQNERHPQGSANKASTHDASSTLRKQRFRARMRMDETREAARHVLNKADGAGYKARRTMCSRTTGVAAAGA